MLVFLMLDTRSKVVNTASKCWLCQCEPWSRRKFRCETDAPRFWKSSRPNAIGWKHPIALDGAGSCWSPYGKRNHREESMLRIHRLRPLAAVAVVLAYVAPASAQSIIDQWQSIQAP